MDKLNGLNFRSYFHVFIFLLLIPVFGCVKEKFDSRKFDSSPTLSSGVAIPIGYSHLSLEKHLQDSTIKKVLRVSKDGFLSLYYHTEVASGIMGNLLSFEGSNVSKQIINQSPSVINLQTPGASQDLSDVVLVPFNLVQTAARIDSISFLSGIFEVYQSSSGSTGTITYSFPGLMKDGVSLVITLNLSDQGFRILLSDYIFIPEHDVIQNNLLRCVIGIHLETPSGPINIGSQLLRTQLTISSPNFNTIYGEFGGYNVILPSFAFDTSIFDKIDSSHFEFVDPGMKLIFSSSIGVPIAFWFSILDAIDRNGGHFQISGPGIPVQTNPKIINYPSLNQRGQTLKDSIRLDRSNSNLINILASNPVSVIVSPMASIISSTNAGTTFIDHNSDYSVGASLELPLWGKGGFLVLLDTMKFNYPKSSLLSPEKLERLIVHINITNSFPVTVSPQIYLLDENRILIDSLFKSGQKIVGAHDSNNDGISDPQIQDPIDIDLSRAGIDNLYKTSYLIVKGKISTTNYPDANVKFFVSDFLDIKLGLIGQVKINPAK